MTNVMRRKITRKLFDEEVGSLREALKMIPINLVQVRAKQSSVDRKLIDLTNFNQLIMDQMGLDQADEGAVEAEMVECEKYLRTYEEVSSEVTAATSSHSNDHDNGSEGTTMASAKRRSNFRLPKLDVKTFNGDPKDWLYFWSQFQAVHENDEMPNEEKYHYLIRYTKEGSPARGAVESFPASAENYPKAVEYLKERFGDKDVLVEVYIRSLLSIVLKEQKNEKKSLADLYDKLETQLRSLQSLGITADTYGALLFPLVESSLPKETLRIWERTRNYASKEVRKDKLNQLRLFLKQEVEGEARVNLAEQFANSRITPEEDKQDKLSKKKVVPTTTDLFSGAEGRKSQGCVFCDKVHRGSPSDCQAAKRMTLRERRRILSQKRICFRCLGSGHMSWDCNSGKVCTVCKGDHDVSICPNIPGEKKESVSSPPEERKDKSLSNHSMEGGILLQTLIVRIFHEGEARRVRALIDTGSMRSYISKKAVRILGFPKVDQIPLSHGLFGGTETKEINHNVYEVTMSAVNGDCPISLPMLDQEIICGNVSKIPNGAWLKEFEYENIQFSDVGGDCQDIHLLIGADAAGKLVTGEIFESSTGPVAWKTKLGWTVMGRLDNPLMKKHHTHYKKSLTNLESPVMKNGHPHVESSIMLMNLNRDMDTLWNLETLGIRDPIEVKSEDQKFKQAVDKFNRNVTVNEDGRYEVGLPWISGHPTVADNLDAAKKRLASATKKLEKEGRVMDYENAFGEWEQLGIIEEVDDDEKTVSYLPHRPVFNPNSTTTPIRPVFDASCRSKGAPALNDCLEKGDNLIELVPAILARFRLRGIGITADIKKAFLQISVKKEDRKFLRFLWWEGLQGDPSRRKLKVFQHCRVVFGVNCSPFLLAATLNFHMDRQEEGKQPLAMELKKAMYVDNTLNSKDSEIEADQFEKEAVSVMMEGKFELRGWVRNGQNRKNPEVNSMSVLGLQWNVEEDTLQINLDNLKGIAEGLVTKRKILSVAHRVYDPVGFTAPVTLFPKMLLQELWKTKLDWDEEVSDKIASQFRDWASDLHLLEAVKIPRWMSFRRLEECHLDLHLFTDASKDASAAVVYLRTDDGSQVGVQLIMAKSRVCPKNGTIPRLELLGCLIGARLLDNVKQYLDFQDVNCYMWTDSANALYWIQNEDNWNPYIHNRVKEINTLTVKQDWRHVSGNLNPADLPSRGCSSKKLLKSRWWEGPQWLYQPEMDWPKSEINVELEVVMAEKRKSSPSLVSTECDQWYLKRFSNYPEIKRLFGWLLRWRNRTRAKRADIVYLRSEELENAERVMWKLIQKEAYSEDRQVLKQLDTIRDKDGLLRVKTKLLNRVDSHDFRFPILLPHGHELVSKMITHEHQVEKHMQVTSLVCHLRERFWITRARITVKKAVSSCRKCKRVTCKSYKVEEGMLPADRVRDASVFEVTGVDLGGPLYLKDESKVYFVLYTCAVYRAVHLELVTSLSTEDFIMSLRRFIARRGRPAIIYSDNGKNFVGLSNKLKKLDWGKLENSEESRGIVWKHIPPGSPWYGGFWERLVGVVKELIKKNVGTGMLSYVELETVFCDVESVVNSRPLTYVTEEASDPVVLTPALFLHGVKPYGNPDLDTVDLIGASSRRMEVMTELRGQFRAQYLSKLRNHEKPARSDVISVGDLVLVGKENVKKSFWPLGIVEKLKPGRGGVIREAVVRTADNVKTYTLQRLFSLEANPWKEVETDCQDSAGMQLRSGSRI